MIEKPTLTSINYEVRDRSLIYFNDPKLYGFLDFCQDVILLSTIQEIASLTSFYIKTFLDVPFCQVFIEKDEKFEFVDGYPTAMHSSNEFTSLLNELKTSIEFKEVVINQSAFHINIAKSKASLPALSKYFQDVNNLQIIPLMIPEKLVGLIVFGSIETMGNRSIIGQQLGYALMVAIQSANAISRVRLNDQVEINQFQSAQAMVKIIEMRDKYLAGHSKRMAELSEVIARNMNCTRKEIQNIGWAASLHDIGKIGIPDRILQKSESLTADEWTIVKKHPEYGAEIVMKASNMAEVALLIRYHHEKYDGSGYPEGKKGTGIPLGSRIIAVADAFTAITAGRAYHSAKSIKDALTEINNCSGTDFDPQVVTEFNKIVRDIQKYGFGKKL